MFALILGKQTDQSSISYLINESFICEFFQSPSRHLITLVKIRFDENKFTKYFYTSNFILRVNLEKTHNWNSNLWFHELNFRLWFIESPRGHWCYKCEIRLEKCSTVTNIRDTVSSDTYGRPNQAPPFKPPCHTLYIKKKKALSFANSGIGTIFSTSPTN